MDSSEASDKWWQRYNKPQWMSSHFERCVALETSEITGIAQFQTFAIPGLLQTNHYMLDLFVAAQARYPTFAFAVRRGRQAHVRNRANNLDFIVTLNALRYCPGNRNVWIEQLNSVRDQLRVVMPGDYPSVANAYHSFELLKLGTGKPAAILLETITRYDVLIEDDVAHAEYYGGVFAELSSIARPLSETSDIIDDIIKESS